ncbi:hypothetical protein P7F60_13600 [Rhizobium sp. YJ-22]|uniref:hypothetical protein n=1 Tax=Rhizobium sp. YJ-22 TaxID=3037556 RepID=UPI001AD2E3D7|nr:hypothetical protein [Rhizobium sp. YJ-22]MBN9029293.1 hypothetical protein [Hyphomicrobiales bacterium]MDG3577429.1 hypothetical protein [Rhizobium sp. YJ-22]
MMKIRSNMRGSGPPSMIGMAGTFSEIGAPRKGLQAHDLTSLQCTPYRWPAIGAVPSQNCETALR